MAESGLPFTYCIGQDARCRRALEVAFKATPRIQDPRVRQGQVDARYTIPLQSSAFLPSQQVLLYD